MAFLDVDIGRAEADDILEEMNLEDILDWLRRYQRDHGTAKSVEKGWNPVARIYKALGFDGGYTHPIVDAYASGTLSLSTRREVDRALDALQLVVMAK